MGIRKLVFALWALLAVGLGGFQLQAEEPTRYMSSRVKPVRGGLQIVVLLPGTVEAQLGMREGDVLQKVNNKPVRSSRDLQRAIFDHYGREESQITLEYQPKDGGSPLTKSGRMFWSRRPSKSVSSFVRPPIVVPNR